MFEYSAGVLGCVSNPAKKSLLRRRRRCLELRDRYEQRSGYSGLETNKRSLLLHGYPNAVIRPCRIPRLETF
jgi:hypothetical protein